MDVIISITSSQGRQPSAGRFCCIVCCKIDRSFTIAIRTKVVSEQYATDLDEERERSDETGNSLTVSLSLSLSLFLSLRLSSSLDFPSIQDYRLCFY